MNASRVLLAVLVCLLALSFTEAVERKSLHSLRTRLRVTVGKDDMQAAEEQFRPIKAEIDAAFGSLDPKADAVEERKLYTRFASGILQRIAPLLGPDVQLVGPEFSQLTEAQLELASKIAFLVRHELRLMTREHMTKRGGCASVLRWFAEARDKWEYKNKDGPTYASLVDKAVADKKLPAVPSGAPVPRAIAAKILLSSTTTNEAVNKALGVSPSGAAQGGPNGPDAPVGDLPQTPAVKELSAQSPPPAEKQDPSCTRGDRVLANAYVQSLQQGGLKDVRFQFDSENDEQHGGGAPSATPGAPAPPKPKIMQ